MIQIRVGKQKKKEKKKIYTENKIGRYVQFLIEREDFLELVASSQRKTIWRESFSNTWQSWCGKWNRIAGQRLCRQQ